MCLAFLHSGEKEKSTLPLDYPHTVYWQIIQYVLVDHVRSVLLTELYQSICKVNDSENM